MGGDPSRRNQNLYCTYHRDKGHTTEQCRVLKDHLEQLVKAGYLKKFMVDPRNQEAGQDARPRGNPLPPPLGVIEVIHAAPRSSQVSKRKGVLAVVSAEASTGYTRIPFPSMMMIKRARFNRMMMPWWLQPEYTVS